MDVLQILDKVGQVTNYRLIQFVASTVFGPAEFGLELNIEGDREEFRGSEGKILSGDECILGKGVTLKTRIIHRTFMGPNLLRRGEHSNGHSLIAKRECASVKRKGDLSDASETTIRSQLGGCCVLKGHLIRFIGKVTPRREGMERNEVIFIPVSTYRTEDVR